jgi:hypothetical protein
MRRTVVDDCWGVRWTVRTRYDRSRPMDSDYNRRNREPGVQARLGPALAPEPSRVPMPDGPESLDDAAQRQQRGFVLGTAGSAAGGSAGLLWAIWRGTRLLREPTDSGWVVELWARGRIRRGATWRVGDRAHADRAVSSVADAVRLGQVPRPEGALLLDVLDERLTVYGAPR